MVIKRNAVIDFSKRLGRLKEKRLAKEFLRLRNVAIDIINPKLESWNDLWEGPCNTQEYLNYISDKQQKVLDHVNVTTGKRSDIWLESDQNADIVGYCKKDGTKITMYIQII